MLLTVDIGNSNIVFARMENRTVLDSFRIGTKSFSGTSDLVDTVRQNLAIDSSDNRPEAVLISSVVPEKTQMVREALRTLTGVDSLVFGETLTSNLVVKLDNPAEIGSDLVVAAVAALDLKEPPLIVFDMGTATTISVLDAAGAFLGGCILPGVGLSLAALSGNAAQLPEIMLEAPERCIGTNTIDCMRSGVIFGAVTTVEGMCDRIEEELGCKATVIATGGIARFIVPHCRREIFYDEHLLARGLALLYEKYKRTFS